MCTCIIVVIHQLALVSLTYIPEGLPLPITKTTHFSFGLWVVPGIALIKVLVGYDRPACVEMRTAPLKQSYVI